MQPCDWIVMPEEAGGSTGTPVDHPLRRCEAFEESVLLASQRPSHPGVRPGTRVSPRFFPVTIAIPATRPQEVIRMSDKPQWQVTRLDDIERRGRTVPVREHLGIQAFGINAFTPSEDGTLINEHDEEGSGQQELYIVMDGAATFEVDGETFEAPAGSLVFVEPGSKRKATGEGTILALGGTPGQAYQGLDWGDAWQYHSESLEAYGEQRYADALDAVKRGLAENPEPP